MHTRIRLLINVQHRLDLTSTASFLKGCGSDHTDHLPMRTKEKSPLQVRLALHMHLEESMGLARVPGSLGKKNHAFLVGRLQRDAVNTDPLDKPG